MNESELNRLLKSKREREEKIRGYVMERLVARLEIGKDEIHGHIQKAEHNLKFVESTLKNGFNDWALVGCYYTLYHTALALIMKRGYLSKNHDATLCILIKEYHKDINKDEVKLINQIYLNNEDILFYARSKEERLKASYSTVVLFERVKVDEIVSMTRLFLNKAKDILE